MEDTPGNFALGTLHLAPGEGARADVTVTVEPVVFGRETYTVGDVPITLDVARMIGGGYSLRMRGATAVTGTCMRCLDVIDFDQQLDIREIDRPSEDDDEPADDLASPYVDGDILALSSWLHDSLILELPSTMAPPVDEADDDRCLKCKRTLIDIGAPAPSTEPVLDPRWSKLSELKLDEN